MFVEDGNDISETLQNGLGTRTLAFWVKTENDVKPNAAIQVQRTITKYIEKS